MKMTTKTLALAGALALSLPALAAAQGGGFTVDPALATAGKKVYLSKGCGGCHQIGRASSSPDLANVQDRRSMEWLRKWLMDTKNMLETDSLAKALLAEYKGMRMPQQRISEQEADALVHYIAQASAKLKK